MRENDGRKGERRTLSSEIKSKKKWRGKEEEAGLHDDVLRIGPKVKAAPGSMAHFLLSWWRLSEGGGKIAGKEMRE